MRGYYEDDGLVFTDTNVSAMERLLAAPEWGRVWFIEFERQKAGYVVLCFGYSVELGGREAYVDELYVDRALRRRGIARSALDLLLDEVRAMDVCAVHLEVDTTNERAVRLYAAAGFKVRDRYHMMTNVLSRSA